MPASIKIMVIDNEEIIRNLLYEVLSDEGYEVTVFDGGQKAVDEARKTHFDITISDIHMPGMDGIETMNAIKEINPHTVFLLMSSRPEKSLEDAIEKKELLCLQKPFSINDLRQTIRFIIQNKIG